MAIPGFAMGAGATNPAPPVSADDHAARDAQKAAQRPITAPAPNEVRQLLVHPAVWPALVAWLNARHIEVLPFPGSDDHVPTFVMGVMDDEEARHAQP